MGKKYDFLKEQLSRNPVRDLLVINDQLVRQKYFAEANDVLKQIDRLEEKIRIFHSKDQKLFDEWYKLTFREDEKAVDQTQAEFRALARFHNWVVAVSRMLDIGMAEAYAMIKEEEEKYARGTPEERRHIEEDREERDEFIEADSQERYNEDPFFESEDEEHSEPGSHLSEVLTRLEDLILREDREPVEGLPARIDRIMALSDDEFKYWLRDEEVAFLLFDISLSWGESQQNYAFFLRVWSQMSKSQKNSFSEVYGALTGQSLEDFVRRMKRRQGSEEMDEEEDFQFNEEFVGPRKSSLFEHSISPPQEEKLKGLYRKLIRKLHPDLQSSKPSEEQVEWIKRIWNQVQKAYNSKDVEALEKLFNLTLLRLNDLAQLTLDEIQQARHWLEKDLKHLETEARQLKKSMAWGFSLRKDYSTLTRKIKRQFEQSLEAVHLQIDEMQKEHRILEMLFQMEDPEPAFQRKKKKAKSRPFGRKRNSRRSRRWDEESENFY